MSERRFMISSQKVRDGSAIITGDIYNHMIRVLRLKAGDTIQLADENGVEYNGTLSQVTRDAASVTIVSTALLSTAKSAGPRITICQALPKGDKIDLVLQKGTELGAFDFRLFGGRRSVAKVHNDQQKGKLERWNRITAEASRQCGRVDIPAVSWRSDAVGTAQEAVQDLRLILWEAERDRSLKNVLSREALPLSVIVAIGPEGGFDPLEVQQFLHYGFQPVSLGNRILRTETASIAILAIMQYIWGEM